MTAGVALVVVAVLAITSQAFAQRLPIFTYPEDELPSIGKLNCIFQDAEGFIWVGGESGAIRYNGDMFRRYSVNDGLADNYVNNILQAPDGTVWLCTWRGISCFDPATDKMRSLNDWKPLNVRNVVFVNGVTYAATDGGLYIRRGSGFYIFRWRDVATGNRSSNLVVDIVYDESLNKVFIATELDGVIEATPTELENLWELNDKNLQKEYESTPPAKFERLHPNLRLGLTSYIGCVEDTTLTVDVRGRERKLMEGNPLSPSDSNLESWFITSIKTDHHGKIWTTSRTTETRELKEGKFRPVPTTKSLLGKINSLSLGKNGEWLIATDQGLWICSESDTVVLDSRDGLPEDNVQVVLRDEQGILWIGTESGVISKLFSQGMVLFDEAEMPTLRGARDALAISDEATLVGGTGGLTMVSGGGATPCSFQPVEGETIYKLALDKNGNIVYITNRAIYSVVNDRQRVLFDKLDPGFETATATLDSTGRLWIVAGWWVGWWDGVELHKDEWLSQIVYFSGVVCCGGDGTILFGNWIFPYILQGDSIFCYDQGWVSASVRPKPRDNWDFYCKYPDSIKFTDRVVTCAAWGDDSAYWAGTFSGELIRISHNEARPIPLERKMGRFNRVCRGRSGELEFVGSQGSLVVSGGKVVWDSRSNLTESPEIRDLYIDGEGRRYLATDEGLFIRNDSLTVCLNTSFGLRHDRVLRVIARDNGKMVLLQSGAVVIVDWEKLGEAIGAPRPLVLTNVVSGNSMTRIGSQILLPRGDRKLELNWALTDYSNEKQNRFAWYVEGMQDSFGLPTDEHKVIFHNLPAGTHKFHLVAYSGFGQRSELETPVTIVVPAFFWETAGFNIFIITLAFGAGWLILWKRYRESQRTVTKIEAEQAVIKEELHKAEETVETLSGLIPICAYCKKIRDDTGFWQQVESYISKRSAAKFTHSYCPDCIKDLYPEIYVKMYGEKGK